MWLLQNVERGSRMMTKLRGTESARILHRRRDHRNASITPNKGGDRWHSRKGVFGVTNHPAQSLTLSLCSLSAIHKQWHHCSSSGVEDKRDPIRKTCDSINISYRNDPEQVFPWKSFLWETLQISSINHSKPPIRTTYPHQRTSWDFTHSVTTPRWNPFHFNRKLPRLLSLTLTLDIMQCHNITIRFCKTTSLFRRNCCSIFDGLSSCLFISERLDKRWWWYWYRDCDLSVLFRSDQALCVSVIPMLSFDAQLIMMPMLVMAMAMTLHCRRKLKLCHGVWSEK